MHEFATAIRNEAAGDTYGIEVETVPRCGDLRLQTLARGPRREYVNNLRYASEMKG
jgi:hypothetical protein